MDFKKNQNNYLLGCTFVVISLGIIFDAGKMIFQCCKLYFYAESNGPLTSRRASVFENVAVT